MCSELKTGIFARWVMVDQAHERASATRKILNISVYLIWKNRTILIYRNVCPRAKRPEAFRSGAKESIVRPYMGVVTYFFRYAVKSRFEKEGKIKTSQNSLSGIFVT